MSLARIRISILACTTLAGLLCWLVAQPDAEIVLPSPSSGMKDDVQFFLPEGDFPFADAEAALAELP